MRRASITEARNQFSRFLRRVRRGETVLITDRGKPVARIEPCHAGDAEDHRLAALIARGVVRPARAGLDVEAFLNEPMPRLPDGVRASDAVSADRDEGER